MWPSILRDLCEGSARLYVHMCADATTRVVGCPSASLTELNEAPAKIQGFYLTRVESSRPKNVAVRSYGTLLYGIPGLSSRFYVSGGAGLPARG